MASDRKVALVTGSTSGIGKAIALRFAKLGYWVVTHGSKPNDGTFNEIREITGEKHRWVAADLRKRKEAERLMDEVISGYGRLDVLVNCAGLFTLAKIEEGIDVFDTYTNMIKFNLDPAVLMTLLATPHLKKTKGCIVNISSNLDRVCLNGSAFYSAAKAGLTMFTKSCASELAPDIRVNSVSPGPVATNMCVRNGQSVESFRKHVGGSCLVKRVGEPDEIARMVTFLCSPESGFITGSDFVIDGGATIKPAGQIMGGQAKKL